MATYDTTDSFERDWKQLSDEQKAQFREAARKFNQDLDSGGPFRKGLRVKGVRGFDGVYEMTWADDGRATFQYGHGSQGRSHIIWRRVGTHEVFSRP